MKTTLLLASVISFTASLRAADEPAARPETSPSNTAPSRISESGLGESITLRRLLQREVVNPDGKRLGTVVDVIIASDPPEENEGSIHIAPSAPPTEANQGSDTGGHNVPAELHSPRQNSAAPRKSGTERIKIVMSTGGFFGVNDRHIVLPFEKVRLLGDDKLIADLTSEEWALLEGAGRYPYSAN